MSNSEPSRRPALLSAIIALVLIAVGVIIPITLLSDDMDFASVSGEDDGFSFDLNTITESQQAVPSPEETNRMSVAFTNANNIEVYSLEVLNTSGNNAQKLLTLAFGYDEDNWEGIVPILSELGLAARQADLDLTLVSMMYGTDIFNLSQAVSVSFADVEDYLDERIDGETLFDRATITALP